MKGSVDSLYNQVKRLQDLISNKESKINRIRKALRDIKYDKKHLMNTMKIENE